MKVFLDANILVSVVNKEYQIYTYTSRILSLSGRKGWRMFTSPICLAIAFYFAEKKYRSAMAKEKLGLLSEHLEIAHSDENIVRAAFADPAVKDLEDGLQYYSAMEAGSEAIVSEDKKDFYFSKIEVFSAQEFYGRHMAPLRP